MDESWNFLKEAPESELGLVRAACNKSGIQVSSSESADMMIDLILKKYGFDVDDSYGEFLDEICSRIGVSSYCNYLELEDKEFELLKCFLFEEIGKMDNSQIVRFASIYSFSNLDWEKLICEIEIRIRTSNNFKTRLYHIVPVLFGVDFPNVFPTDITEINIIVGGISIEDAPIVSALIALRYEHDRLYDNNYIIGYISKMVEKNTIFDDNKKAILSIMLCFASKIIENNNQNENNTIEGVYSFLKNKKLEVPYYILNKFSDIGEYKDVIGEYKYVLDYLMGLVFPADVNERVCLSQMNNEIRRFRSIAFFEYKFPITVILEQKESFFLKPNDEFARQAIMLYLLCHGLNPCEHLLSETDLCDKSLECAAIPIDSNFSDYPTFLNHVQPENPLIYGFRCFIQKIGALDESSMGVIKALKGFIQLSPEIMDRLVTDIDNQTQVSERLIEIKELVHMICSLRKNTCN